MNIAGFMILCMLVGLTSLFLLIGVKCFGAGERTEAILCLMFALVLIFVGTLTYYDTGGTFGYRQ